jgi:hypothetical protein
MERDLFSAWAEERVRLGRNRLGWTSGWQPAVRWADF